MVKWQVGEAVEQRLRREESVIVILFVSWILLNLWDASTTLIGLTMYGAKEVNPLLAMFSPMALVAVKLMVATIIGLFMTITYRKGLLIYGCIMVGGVGVWNTVKLLGG